MQSFASYASGATERVGVRIFEQGAFWFLRVVSRKKISESINKSFPHKEEQ